MTDPGPSNRSRRRLVVLASLLAVFAVGLVAKLAQLMIFVPAQQGEGALVLPEVERGAILDRQGRILAITTRQKMLSAWVPTVTNPDESAGLLARILGREKAAILDNWAKHPGYAVVKRTITDEEAQEIASLKADGKLAGIRIEDSFGRSYPEGRLASHVIGYVGLDNVALDGIEYTFNEELAPQPVSTDKDTVFGNQVFLTIDANIQYIVERAARKALEDNKADSLMILVMDAHSAEILAWCALPDFDPNQFQDEVRAVDQRSLTNAPLVLSYEPGSVFKIFSLAAMLELGAITPESQFTCNGYYEKPLPNGSSIRIRCVGVHGVVTPQKIIQFSCNAGAAYASDYVEAESFHQMLVRFGFGKPTDLPLLGEAPGILAKPNLWSGRSKPTIAIGQEVSVSAAQVLTAATVIANGGVMLKPLIVRKIVSPEGRLVKEFAREPLQEVVSPGVAKEILEMMETATSPQGTARRAAIDGIRISAKTGTAQVVSKETGTYSENDFVASLIGIFPTDDPQIIMYVVIKNPRGQSYYGSTIAAPVFREAAIGVADYLHIPREGMKSETRPDEIAVAVPGKVVITDLMPDLTGVPKRLLLPLLLRDDIAVTIHGNGAVAKQDPPAGTRVKMGMKILLELQ